MYKEAAEYRSAMRDKAQRMTMADPHQKVDSSDWTPAEALNTTAKTGMRPVSKQHLATGGAAKPNAGRKARKAGGRLADDFANVDQKQANESRPGEKHEGGMKKGGRTRRADGGGILKEALGHGFLGLAGLGISHLMGDDDDAKTPAAAPKKRGGRASGGMSPEEGAASVPTSRMAFQNGSSRMSKAAGLKRGGSVSDGELEGTRPTGGRSAHASGGKAGKGKMNVNIIIAQPSHDQAPPMGAGPAPMPPPPKPIMPPPMAGPPMGGPPPMPAGGIPPNMMPRKRGGRAHHGMSAGSGSGEGRLEKLRAYGKEARELDGHY